MRTADLKSQRSDEEVKDNTLRGEVNAGFGAVQRCVAAFAAEWPIETLGGLPRLKRVAVTAR